MWSWKARRAGAYGSGYHLGSMVVVTRVCEQDLSRMAGAKSQKV